jgi:hypothetical protein
MNELDLYRKDIAKAGGSTGAVDLLIEEALSMGDSTELEAVLQQLDVEASKLDWFRDSDYEAVAVEAAAGRALTALTRRRLLAFALSRAQWCASCASAGGEGLARSVHVRELEELLRHVA